MCNYKNDREKIDELIKDNDSYQMLIVFLDEAIKDNKAKDIVKNSLESYIDSINIVGADEQNVSKKAKTIIAILFRDYWATDIQREKIKAKEMAENPDKKKTEQAEYGVK